MQSTEEAMRDTIDMAREAGFELDCTSLEWHKRIKAFEALVRADERDRASPVPLTDEQIWDAYIKAPIDIDCHSAVLHNFARAIEQAHGITEKGQP
jgi:hypothetical protein